MGQRHELHLPMSHTHFPKNERGVSAILVAGSLIMLMGMAAIAIDLGQGYNERRQDQTAADMAVMSASVDVLAGVPTMRDAALQFVRNNVDSTFSNAEWQTLWTSCTDPNRNAGGFSFQSVPAPAGWGGSLDCISVDPAGFIRVRVPDQIVRTTFGRVLGVTEIHTNAAAIARLGPRAAGGILPFGLTSIPGSGDHVCMSSASGGLAVPPCDGPANGNFGTLGSPQYGNTEMQTAENCTMSPTGQTLSLNIAIGLDHLITLAPNTSAASEVRDQCFNFGPNTMLTKTGFSGTDVEAGLTGPVPGFSPPGTLPRLQFAGPFVTYFGRQMNNSPLWSHIDGSLGAGQVPASCVKSTFDNANTAWSDVLDFDGDGTVDKAESWQHMGKCLEDYVAGSGYSVLFSDSIGGQPRFAYVPQFFESSLGSGTDWNHIRQFRAMWIQGTWWKRNATDIKVFHPGEPCADATTLVAASCSAANHALIQLSGFILPDDALPSDLRGDPPPWANGLNPFRPYLYR